MPVSRRQPPSACTSAHCWTRRHVRHAERLRPDQPPANVVRRRSRGDPPRPGGGGVASSRPTTRRCWSSPPCSTADGGATSIRRRRARRTTRDRQLIALADAHLARRRRARSTSWCASTWPSTPTTCSRPGSPPSTSSHDPPESEHPCPPPVTRPRTYASSRSPGRTALRWLVSFVGFPLGGFAASCSSARSTALLPALVGGLVTGAVLGAVQAWALRPRPPPAARLGRSPPRSAWPSGSAVGVRGPATRPAWPTSLVQGAVCGVAVGAAQAVALRRLPHGSRRPIAVVRLAGLPRRDLGHRLDGHHRDRRRGRRAVHRLRLQRRGRRHRPDRRPPARPRTARRRRSAS